MRKPWMSLANCPQKQRLPNDHKSGLRSRASPKLNLEINAASADTLISLGREPKPEVPRLALPVFITETCKIKNIPCFKLLSFGIICYTAIND